MALYTLKELKTLDAQAGDCETPYRLMDANRLRENCRRYLRAFTGAEVQFAVMANI